MASDRLKVFLELDGKQYEAALVQAGQNLKNFESRSKSSSSSISGGLASIAAGGAAAATAALYALGKAALTGAADMQKNRVAFETMLGSASKADKLLNEIKTFAKETPFEIPGVVESAKKLMAFGISEDEVIEKMRRLGDASMGNQETFARVADAYGKSAAKGKVTMEEMNRFLEAGIPVLDVLAEKHNTNKGAIVKMIEAGKIGFKDLDEAIKKLTTGSGKFAGLMEKQSKTLGGAWSNLSDAMGQAATALGENMAPGIQKLITALTQGGPLADAMGQKILQAGIAISKMADRLADAFSGANKVYGKLESMEAAIRQSSSGLKSFYDWISKIADVLANPKWEILKAIGGLAEGKSISEIIDRGPTGKSNYLSDLVIKGVNDAISLLEGDGKKKPVFTGGTGGGEDIAKKRFEFERQWRLKALQADKDDKFSAMEEERVQALEAAAKLGADTLNIERAFAEKRQEIEKQVTQEKIRQVQQYMGLASEMMSGASTTFQEYNQAEMASENNKYQKKKRLLDALQLTEQQKEQASYLLEYMHAKRVSELERRQFEASKVFKVGQIAMNAASAIAGFWASFAPMGYVGIASAAVATALVGIMAGIQTGIVLAQKAPAASFAVGAWDVQSDMSAQIHKGEMILPRPFAESIRSGEGALVGKSGVIDVNIPVVIDGKEIGKLIKKIRLDEARDMGVRSYAY